MRDGLSAVDVRDDVGRFIAHRACRILTAEEMGDTVVPDEIAGASVADGVTALDEPEAAVAAPVAEAALVEHLGALRGREDVTGA